MTNLLHRTCEEYRKIVSDICVKLKNGEEIDEEAAHAAFRHIYWCPGAGLGKNTELKCGELWCELNQSVDKNESQRLRDLLDAYKNQPLPLNFFGVNPANLLREYDHE